MIMTRPLMLVVFMSTTIALAAKEFGKKQQSFDGIL